MRSVSDLMGNFDKHFCVSVKTVKLPRKMFSFVVLIVSYTICYLFIMKVVEEKRKKRLIFLYDKNNDRVDIPRVKLAIVDVTQATTAFFV